MDKKIMMVWLFYFCIQMVDKKWYCYYIHLQFVFFFFFGICITQFICVLIVCLIYPRRRNGIRFQRSWCEGRTFVSFIGIWSGWFRVLYCPHVYHKYGGNRRGCLWVIKKLKKNPFWCYTGAIITTFIFVTFYSFYFQNREDEYSRKNIKVELRNYSEVFLQKSSEQQNDGRKNILWSQL